MQCPQATHGKGLGVQPLVSDAFKIRVSQPDLLCSFSPEDLPAPSPLSYPSQELHRANDGLVCRAQMSSAVVGNNAMAGCWKELRQQGGKRVHKKTHYAKVDGAKCCNEATAHKNNVICQSRVISRAVKLFAGKSRSGLLARSSSRAGLATHPELRPMRQRQSLLAPALAGSCGPGQQA